jgi:hypothetical protein
MATQESHSVRLEDLNQALKLEQVRADKLAQSLAIEQIYAEKLAQQLRYFNESRIWRAAQWARQLVGSKPHIPDLDRSPPTELSTDKMTNIFQEIYVTNAWGSDDSLSGHGSDLQQTKAIREILPILLGELDVRSMLDVPCGDFHWMRMLKMDIDYIGADVVSDLIALNNDRYGNDRRHFQHLDISNDQLPRVDLIFCRDLLVHFSFSDALRTIRNIKRSGATYLLTTTFTDRKIHNDIETGQWRVINLQLPPFNFPPPLRLIKENCTEKGMDVKSQGLGNWMHKLRQKRRMLSGKAWADKSLGLWRLSDL